MTIEKNIENILKTRDITKLTRQTYKHLTLYCGFIAHYSYEGFITDYQKDFNEFRKELNQNLQQQHINGYFTNPSSYLIESGKAETNIKLLSLFDIVKEDITKQVLINDPEIKQLRLMEIIEQFFISRNIPFSKYMHVLGVDT